MVNNNKRKEIENQENDNNDDDDNGLLTYKKFKEDINYNSIRSKQLQTIANSLGLPNNGKKQEVYKRIEGYFLSKKVKNDLTNSTTNQPQQQQPQQQPQQKQYVLLIKDVDQLEIYFWKAFRNMIIFKNIFSNFKSKQFSYHDLIGIDENFLKSYSNSLEIIKDSIKGNINHQIIRNTNDILNIIKTLKKKDNQTISFYNTLFSTFSSSSSTTTTTTTQSIKSLIFQFDENIDIWIQRMILNENLVALDQFIKFFKINSEILKKSIEMHIDPSFFNVFSYNNLKIYNYLKPINAIPTSHIKQRFSNIDLPESLSFDYKFKRLIKLYKLLVDQTKFKEIQEIHQQQQEQQQQEQQREEQQQQILDLNKDYIEKLNQLILELNEIQLSHFTDDQLNSTIKNLLNQTKTTTTTTTTTTTILITNNNNCSDLKDIIKKYYKSIYLFLKIIKEGKHDRNLMKPFHYYLYFKKKMSVNQLYQIFCEFFVKNYTDYLIFFKSILIDRQLEKNQILELVSKFLDIYNSNFNYSSFNSFCRVVFSINDTELIDHLIKTIKKLKLAQNSKIQFPSVSGIISTNFQYINKNEIVDFFFENYRSETTLFDDQNQNWNNNNVNIIYHIEKIMESIGKKLRLCFVKYISWFASSNKNNEKKYNINILLDQLKRAISKPLFYTYIFDGSNYYNGHLFNIFGWSLENGNQVLINYFLSNKQFKQPFRFSEIIYDTPPPNKMPNLVKLIFNNISKESIESKLYQVKGNFDFSHVHLRGYYYERDDFIPLTSTISTTTTTDSEEVGQTIIGKTESFDFTISPRMLFVCLYYLDRVDDIFYLFDKIPEIFSSTYFTIFTKESYLYNICSSYYLELFINYFIENLNDNTINHLYTCLCVASRKGFIQIFNSILSSNQNSQSLLKVRTKTNQSSLFQLNFLCDMVLKSIDSSNFQLSNLLIDSIDFPQKNKKVLKLKIFNSPNNK
ncbi:hypothetical protein ACTFIW_002964 [Dictyostelium discoideum]